MELPKLDITAILIELLLLFVAVLTFFIDLFIKRKIIWGLSIISVIICVILLLFMPFSNFTEAFSLDFFSAFIKIILLLGFILILFLFKEYFKTQSVLYYPEYFGFLIFALLGGLILVSIQDFFTFYIAIEIMSFSVYFLVATSYKVGKKGVEGAFKYFFLGSLGSIFLILSIAFIYKFTGTLAFKDVFIALKDKNINNELLLSISFFIIGISVKLGLFPFHMWVPDVYESAILPLTSFMASIVKFAMFLGFIKILLISLYPINTEIGKIFLPIVLLTIIGGNLMAIRQNNLIRLLAYSSIAHTGYAGLGFVIADYIGYTFSIFYMLVYLLTAIGIFGLAMLLEIQDKKLININNLYLLSEKNYLIKFLFLIFLFSLIGIPPTAGFITKLYLLLGLIKINKITIAVIVLIFSLIGAYPYLKVLKHLYMNNSKNYKIENFITIRPINKSFWLPVGVCGFLILLIGIYPKLFYDFLYKTIFLYISIFYSQ